MKIYTEHDERAEETLHANMLCGFVQLLRLEVERFALRHRAICNGLKQGTSAMKTAKQYHKVAGKLDVARDEEVNVGTVFACRITALSSQQSEIAA